MIFDPVLWNEAKASLGSRSARRRGSKVRMGMRAKTQIHWAYEKLKALQYGDQPCQKKNTN